MPNEDAIPSSAYVQASYRASAKTAHDHFERPSSSSITSGSTMSRRRNQEMPRFRSPHLSLLPRFFCPWAIPSFIQSHIPHPYPIPIPVSVPVPTPLDSGMSTNQSSGGDHKFGFGFGTGSDDRTTAPFAYSSSSRSAAVFSPPSASSKFSTRSGISSSSTSPSFFSPSASAPAAPAAAAA